MRKVISFMHASLDGFVAGFNGEMDWFHDEEILKMQLTAGTTDAAIMDVLLSNDGELLANILTLPSSTKNGFIRTVGKKIYIKFFFQKHWKKPGGIIHTDKENILTK